MSCVLVFLIILSSSSLFSEVSGSANIESKTKGYNDDLREDFLEINGDGPFFKIVQDTRAESDHRSFHSDPPDLNLHNNPDDLTKITLRDFLQLYTKKQNRKPQHEYNKDDTPHNMDKVIQDEQHKINSKDRSKNWMLVDVHKHKHPFEDKKGWVSLEPIPWSVSKISKWQSKYKPNSERPWDEDGPISSQRPYLPDEDYGQKRPVSITPPSPYMYNQQPTESSDRYDTFYDHGDRPRPTPSPSIYPRPTAYFGHKVHVEAHFPSNSYSSTEKPYLSYHNQKDCHHPNHPYGEIMTDGSAPNFPEPNPYESLKRRGTELDIHPDLNPISGDGEWVLLSTTKGYKPQRNRQRSLDIGGTSDSAQSLRATRGIRLTVLPPLKGSKVNMTTSHGGLLQVESTFESVEQAKQKFDKKQNTPKIKGKRKRRKNVKKTIKKIPVGQTHQTVATVPRRGADPGAVMAAVGAGMIPATMAMMVPIAMSGG